MIDIVSSQQDFYECEDIVNVIEDADSEEEFLGFNLCDRMFESDSGGDSDEPEFEGDGKFYFHLEDVIALSSSL